MTQYKFSKRSLKNLKDVHPLLISIVVTALKQYTTIDFSVLEGIRNPERQQELFNKGTTQTLNSKHLPQKDGYAYAVDLLPYIQGSRGDAIWRNKDAFKAVSDAMFAAAKALNINIRWGGDWNQNGRSDDERFYDGPHFELI